MAISAFGSGTITPALGTCTITIASPGVVTYNAHGLNNGDRVVFRTTGALPTGLTAGTTYFVVNRTTNTFEVSATRGGASINTSGSQSGTHTLVGEHTLADVNQAGTYVAKTKTEAMAAGDVLELRWYDVVLTGDTSAVAYAMRYSGVQHADDRVKTSVPISTDLAESRGLEFTLRQVFGTARAYDWKVLKFA